MAGPWLYLISAGAGRSFDLENGQSVPVTIDSYRALVENERINEDRNWYISQHWKHVEKDDEVFIYTGDGDLGIIGYATVDDVEQRDDGWYIHPWFDLGRSRALLDNPIPAAVVRKWGVLRKNVKDLEPFQAQLRARLPWASGLHVKDDVNEPTSDLVILEERVQILHARGKVKRPAGNLTPKSIPISGKTAFERLASVIEWVLQEAEGDCELCTNPGPFLKPNGERYLEVHHVIRLVNSGADTVTNAVALCPNCHRKLHSGKDAMEATEKLYAQVARLIK